jgi:hypothetical protein
VPSLRAGASATARAQPILAKPVLRGVLNIPADAALVIDPARRALLRHLLLDAGVVAAGRLQRAFGKSALGALVLDRGVELHNIIFSLGPIGVGLRLDLFDLGGQRLDFLFGVDE